MKEPPDDFDYSPVHEPTQEARQERQEREAREARDQKRSSRETYSQRLLREGRARRAAREAERRDRGLSGGMGLPPWEEHLGGEAGGEVRSRRKAGQPGAEPRPAPRTPKVRSLPKPLRRLLGVLAIVSAITAPVALAMAYGHLPREIVGAWPVLALLAAPAALNFLVHLGLFSRQPLLAADLELSAAEWLRQHLPRIGRGDLGVHRLDQRTNTASFYHPRSRSIVLGEDVHNEHTARAYAVAAHELGHAVLHQRMPWTLPLGRIARGHALRCFRTGVISLLAIALTGARGWLAAPFALIAVGASLQIFTAFDEAGASRIAMRELRTLGLSADQERAARRHLAAALATYVSVAMAFVLPLAIWPQLAAFFGDGLLAPGSPLSDRQEWIAGLTALAVIGGAIGAGILVIARGPTGSAAAGAMLTVIAARLYGATLTAVLCNQPLAAQAPWAMMLAIVPSYPVLAALPTALLSIIPNWVRRGVLTSPLPLPSQHSRLPEISIQTMISKEPVGSFGLLWLLGGAVITTPLAVLYLLAG